MFKVSPSLRPGPHLPSSPVPGFPAPWVPPDAFRPSLVSSSPRKPWPPTCRPPAQSWISRAWTSLTPGPILPVSTPQLQASPFPKPLTPPSLPASALPTGHVSSFRSPEPHPFSYHRASLFLAGGSGLPAKPPPQRSSPAHRPDPRSSFQKTPGLALPLSPLLLESVFRKPSPQVSRSLDPP